MSNGAKINQTAEFEIEFQAIQQIEHTPITQVNSYSSSHDNKFLIICTQTGIVIVFNALFKFKCYIHQSGPFWLQSVPLDKQLMGVKLGSLVPNRNQAAIIPNFTSKHYQQTHIYIFDYEMKCILHSIDFFLSIDQLWITQSQIFISNKKRFIIYNYQNDTEKKGQKYYLDMYESKQPNNRLRYFQTFCDDYEDPFTINEIMQIDADKCMCGKFFMSKNKPYTVAFIQTVSFNYQRRKKICIYSQREDNINDFLKENIPDQPHFDIAISEDGNYLAFTFNYGRKIKVYNLKENCLYCVLYVSSTIKDILKMQMFTACIQDKQHLCLGVIRKSEKSTATLHIFKIQKKSPTQQVRSQFKRYFPLYQQTFKDYGISQTLINPGLFIQKNIVYIYLLCGIAFEAIDFYHTGNREKKDVDICNTNHIKWTQEKEETF